MLMYWRGLHPNSIYDANITVIQKTKFKKSKIKKSNVPDEHRCKSLQQNISKLNSTFYQKYYTP